MDRSHFRQYVKEYIETSEAIASDSELEEYADAVYRYYISRNESGRLNVCDAHAAGEAYVKTTELIAHRISRMLIDT